MKSLMQIIRVLGNIILFLLYVAIANVIVGFIIGWLITDVAGYNVPVDGSWIFDVIAVVTTVLVILVSLTWRKYFYFTLQAPNNK